MKRLALTTYIRYNYLVFNGSLPLNDYKHKPNYGNIKMNETTPEDILKSKVILSISDMCRIWGCSRTALWRATKTGEIPEPTQTIGNQKGWYSQPMRELIQQRMQATQNGELAA